LLAAHKFGRSVRANKREPGPAITEAIPPLLREVVVAVEKVRATVGLVGCQRGDGDEHNTDGRQGPALALASARYGCEGLKGLVNLLERFDRLAGAQEPVAQLPPALAGAAQRRPRRRGRRWRAR